MQEWYYAQNREKFGPVPHSQLVEFLQVGVITRGTLVWTNSMPEWLPAIQVPGLMGDEAPAPAPTPAPAAATPTAPGQAPVAQVPVAAGIAAEAAPSQLPAAAQAASAAAPTGNPWDDQIAQAPAAVQAEGGAPDAAAPSPKATATLSFDHKRTKPSHKRATTKVKNLIVRVAAIVIAVGILGGGGYLGAQYLGLFEPEVDTRVRYLPNNPDFVVTVNMPKVMSIMQSVGVDPQGVSGSVNTTIPLDPYSVQDITVAGNVHEKRWVVIATLSEEIDITKLFPGGKGPSDTTRVAGTKVYYDREMASYGMDFAFAMPSKTTMLVGPMDTLKGVLKRRTAPMVADAFKPLLDAKNSEAWFAGAADINALWRLAEDGLPVDLTSEQRWLAESIGSVSFTWSGVGEYDFALEAHCKNPKDAPLIAEKAQAMIDDQRRQFLEMMSGFGQQVTADTRTLWDQVQFKVDGGVIHVTQHVDRAMLEEGGRQLAATGALPQP